MGKKDVKFGSRENRIIWTEFEKCVIDADLRIAECFLLQFVKKVCKNIGIILLKIYFSVVFDFTRDKYNKGAGKN